MLQSWNMTIASFWVNTEFFHLRALRHLEQVFLQSAIRLILLDVLEDVDLALELIYRQRSRPSRRLLQQCGFRLQVGLWGCRRFVFIPFRHLQKLVKVVLYPTGKHKVQMLYFGFKTMAANLTFSENSVTYNFSIGDSDPHEPLPSDVNERYTRTGE